MTLEALADRVAALEARALVAEAQAAALRARVAALESSARPNRDEADAALRQVLPRSTEGLPFQSSELIAHTRTDADLRRALIAADLTTPEDVGLWLRDSKGTRDGVTIAKDKGRLWRATYTSDTYVSDRESAM